MVVTRNRLRFFLDQAGYATPPGRAVCAIQLARAELWREREHMAGRLRVCWTHDDSHDVDGSIDWPERDQREYMRKVEAGLIEFWGCQIQTLCLHCGHWQTVADLWGIEFDSSNSDTREASRNYRRVVEAELCLEAMAR